MKEKDNIVFFELPEINKKRKGYKQTTMLFLRAYSWVDDDGQRKIDLNKWSGRIASDKVEDLNKDNYVSSIRVLYNEGILEKEEDTGLTILPDLTKNFVPLPKNFMREILARRNSDYINCYLALHRRWQSWKNKKRESPTFTQGDLIKEALNQKNSRSGKYHDRVRTALKDLVTDGVIDFEIIPVVQNGKVISFIRKLTTVRECFVMEQAYDAYENKLIQGIEEAESADTELELGEAIGQIGLGIGIVDINKERVKLTDGREVFFAENGDDARNYPDGIMEKIEEEGWFVLPSGIARQF